MSIALDRLRQALQISGHSAILISNPTNVFWLTGFTGSFGQVVVTSSDAVFITDSRYTIQAAEQVSDIPVKTFASPITGVEFLKIQLEELSIQQLVFESASTTVAQLSALKSKLPQIEWIEAGDLVEILRMTKTESEIQKLRKACQLTDATFSHLLRLVQPGVTEYEIQLELEFYIRRQGGVIAFDPIVVSGANSARPHGKATEKPLEFGDLVTFDFGARLDGYNADMTRTVVVGKADERTREIYDQVLKVQLSCLEMLRPGVIAGDVDAHARAIFDEKGWAKYFGHGLGHGLGILVHDTGRLGSGSPTILEPNQVWTVEPGVYFDGFGGCRIEDDVVITETGIEILNTSSKELLELGG